MTAAAIPLRRGRLLRWLASARAPYYLLMGSAGLLVAFGLVMVLSASSVQSYSATGSSFTVFEKQAMWVALGLPCLWVASRLPVRVHRFLGYPFMFLSVLLLLAVLVPHVGRDVYGATRWIELPGGLQIQPSEPAKLALVIWGADLLTRKERRLGQLRHLLVPLVPGTVLLVLLVLAEPDLGTAAVLLLVMLAMLWVAGAPLRVFALTGLGLSAGMAGLAVVAPYRLARLTTFLHPLRATVTADYQPLQGLYALASGGWWGLGLGASRQKWAYLPNQYTDYIFAVIGEELGLVGTVLLVALFVTLAYGGVRIARDATDPFCRLAAAGVVAWLAGQALVNMGAVVGLLPVTGVPLPLVSFGGSSLLPELYALGMLASFGARRRRPG
jgi:cell division protein FtsW